MSLDALLVIIFLIVLPLIEMFRAAAQRRQEQQKSPQPPQSPPLPQRQPPATMQTPLPPEPVTVPQAPQRAAPYAGPPVVAVPVPIAEAVRQTMSDKIAARRRATRSQPVAKTLLSTEVRNGDSTIRRAVRSLRSRDGVHRAMVLMTILGPCRAIEPHAWNEKSTRQY